MAGVPFLAAQAFPARGERVTEIIGINALPAAVVIVVPAYDVLSGNRHDTDCHAMFFGTDVDSRRVWIDDG